MKLSAAELARIEALFAAGEVPEAKGSGDTPSLAELIARRRARSARRRR